MKQKELNRINAITNSFHDDVATVNEEYVDGNVSNVKATIDKLIESLKDFKSNLELNEVQGS